MPKVSVVMPTYNRSEFIRDAIMSVQAQSHGDWELIVVDDGSTDETRAIVEAFIRNDSRIRYVYQSKRGVSAARARSVELAHGEYIAFLDDDDEFAFDKLKTQVEFLDAHPGIGLVYSYVDMVDQDRNFIRRWPYRRAESFIELIKDCTIQPNSVLVRMECFTTLGTFQSDPTGGGDYEMWLRIAKFYPIVFLSIKVGIYRWHSQNISHNTRRRCFNDVNVFKALMHYHLTPEERREVFKRVIELTYTRGSDALYERQYGDALFYFRQALRFSKSIGIYIPWGRSKSWFYRLSRPYLALITSALLSFRNFFLAGSLQNA